MGSSVHVMYGFGFVTEAPDEEDFSEAFKAMDIDTEDPYDCWYEIEEKFPGIEVRPFGHYDYRYGYLICAKSTARSGWDATLEFNPDEGFGVPTMTEIVHLSSLLGYFYPDFSREAKHMVVGSYS